MIYIYRVDGWEPQNLHDLEQVSRVWIISHNGRLGSRCSTTDRDLPQIVLYLSDEYNSSFRVERPVFSQFLVRNE